MAARAKTILVPTDFSGAAELAIRYASELAKKLELTVTLLHIFESLPVNEAMRKIIRSQLIFRDAADRLAKRAEQITSDSRVRAKAEIKEGNIFEHIGKAAEEFDAMMVVMGTHGTKGVQHFVGSFAARVIQSSPVPILTVQDGAKAKIGWLLSDIVIPVDYTTNLKQVCSWTMFLGNTIGVKPHILRLSPPTGDPIGNYSTELEGMQTELSKLKNGFTFQEIRCQPDKVAGEVLTFASSCHAGMIIISQQVDDQQYVLGEQQQKILLNGERIPVVCLDNRRVLLPA